MRVRVLGPVQVCVGDAAVEVGPPQRCLVFAALAVDAGRLVSSELLIDRVWGQSPPRGAWRTVQTHVASIRGLLKRTHVPEPAMALTHRRGGYVLEVDPDLVDVHRFGGLVRQAADGARTAVEQIMTWREAMGLWRGVPLAALAGEWVERTREAWYLQYRDAVPGWAYAEIRAGNPTVVVGPLVELIERYPLVEALPAMLMRALYAAGRRPDALSCYAAARQRIDDELAEAPGAELQAVYQAILRHDASLPAPLGPLPAGAAVPAQLPTDVRGFAGRADQLAQLDAIATMVGEQTTSVVISAIAGTAGVGKTALAIHWAHRVARRFPDGQLYVNLRGFAPGGTAVDPADAVRGFLGALGIPPDRIPSDRDALTALYRTQLANKSMLVVLDNARDAEHVRPLLPGAPGCLVLITSRSRLASLVATTGAHPLLLDLLTADEARDLLTRRLGARRVAGEPEAVDSIITRCARLPLALAIVAARATFDPGLSLATLADELHDTATRLDVLTDADPVTDVRAVFSWSYSILDSPAARLFRLLGLHPGPDVSAAAAASCAGLLPAQVRPLLAELIRAHLVVEHQPGRYTFHDLLRTYAVHLVHSIDPADQRHAAIRRTLDHYLHTAHTANRLLNPSREPITPAAASDGATPEHPTDHQQALAWFGEEHAVLLAAIDLAGGTGFDPHAWQLAWTLHDYLDRRGHWHDLVVTQLAAVAAADRLQDSGSQARAHRLLARAYNLLDRHDDAQSHLRYALDFYDRAGDRVGQALTHHTLATLRARLGRHADALHHARRALELYRADDHRSGQARALNGIGWYLAQLGHHGPALGYCEQSLALHQELGDHYGQAGTWDSLGYTHHHLGHHTQAVTCYQQAARLYRELGDQYHEALILTHLGDTHDAVGDTTAARDTYQQALRILRELNHGDADLLWAKLHHLGPAGGFRVESAGRSP